MTRDYDDYISAMADAPRVLFSQERYIHRGRSAHLCFFCREIIEPGQPKLKVTVMTDMDPKPYTTYEHPYCPAKEISR